VGGELVNWHNATALAIEAHHGGPDLMAGAVDASGGVAPSLSYVGLSRYPSKECQKNRHKKVCKSPRIGCELAKIGVPSKPKVALRLSTSHDVIARRREPTTSDMIANNTSLHAGSDWCLIVKCVSYGIWLVLLIGFATASVMDAQYPVAQPSIQHILPHCLDMFRHRHSRHS